MRIVALGLALAAAPLSPVRAQSADNGNSDGAPPFSTFGGLAATGSGIGNAGGSGLGWSGGSGLGNPMGSGLGTFATGTSWGSSTTTTVQSQVSKGLNGKTTGSGAIPGGTVSHSSSGTGTSSGGSNGAGH